MLSWWCSGNNISLYSQPPDLRCNFTPPSCTIVLMLLLELASKLLLQYLAIFSCLCLKARYQPESLPHLFQVFVEKTPSQGHSTYFLSLFFFFFFHSITSSVQLFSCVQLFATPITAAHQASLSITNCGSLFKFMSIELVMPSNHLTLFCPLLLLPSIFPSIRVFSNESALHIRCPKYWSFIISPSNEYLGQISFRRDWFDLLAVQGTLKSLLQHHSSKALAVLKYQ